MKNYVGSHCLSTRLHSLLLADHRPPSSRRAGIYSPVALLPLARRQGMTPLVRVSLYCPLRVPRDPNFAGARVEVLARVEA